MAAAASAIIDPTRGYHLPSQYIPFATRGDERERIKQARVQALDNILLLLSQKDPAPRSLKRRSRCEVRPSCNNKLIHLGAYIFNNFRLIWGRACCSRRPNPTSKSYLPESVRSVAHSTNIDYDRNIVSLFVIAPVLCLAPIAPLSASALAALAIAANAGLTATAGVGTYFFAGDPAVGQERDGSVHLFGGKRAACFTELIRSFNDLNRRLIQRWETSTNATERVALRTIARGIGLNIDEILLELEEYGIPREQAEVCLAELAEGTSTIDNASTLEIRVDNLDRKIATADV